MKKYKLVFLVSFLLLLAIPTVAQKNKVDIFGYYSIENATKAFANIEVIHLGGNYGANELPPFYGLIRLKKKSAKDFRLLKPTLKGKNLTFKTKSVGGIHYEFSGAFTRLEDFPTTQPEAQVILKGRLTKYKGSKKTATGNFRFSYSAGD